MCRDYRSIAVFQRIDIGVGAVVFDDKLAANPEIIAVVRVFPLVENLFPASLSLTANLHSFYRVFLSSFREIHVQADAFRESFFQDFFRYIQNIIVEVVEIRVWRVIFEAESDCRDAVHARLDAGSHCA